MATLYYSNDIIHHCIRHVEIQWRIQDFPWGGGGAPTPKIAIIFHIFAENCMKMKEFGPPGGVRPWRPPLDPPMGIDNGIRLKYPHCTDSDSYSLFLHNTGVQFQQCC